MAHAWSTSGRTLTGSSDVRSTHSSDGGESSMTSDNPRHQDFWAEPRAEPDRILVVQSNPSVSRRITEVLAGPGRRIRVVGGAAQARDIVHHSPPDIFVLDVLLSDGDGRSLAAEFRRTPSTRALPVVMTVPRKLAAIRGDLLGQGADAVLERPVDPDLLAAAVGSELRRGRNLRGSDRVDPLTGLFNRNGVAALFRERRSRGEMQGLALLEVTEFGELTADLGWDGGERLLTQLAAVLDGRLRPGEEAGRWGGPRFILLGPESRAEAFLHRVEEIQAELAAHPFRHLDGRTFRVKLSYGVAGHRDDGFDRVLTAAEVALRNPKGDRGGGGHEANEGADGDDGACVLLFDPQGQAGDLLEARLVQEGIRVDRLACAEDMHGLPPGSRPVMAIIDHDIRPEASRLLQAMANGPLGPIPVLILTEEATEERLVEAIEGGALDWTLKPVVPHELMDRVRRLLP
ncbi:MAG: response regulator [Gemmatimonadales bacterium]|nr:MAG: response regulator [Gemmatimonadales bacterium]